MAERKVQRSRKGQTGAQASVKARSPGVARGQPDTVATLRAECERLKTELAAARAEIAALEARQDDALNRIEWVLDSLDSLSEVEP